MWDGSAVPNFDKDYLDGEEEDNDDDHDSDTMLIRRPIWIDNTDSNDLLLINMITLITLTSGVELTDEDNDQKHDVLENHHVMLELLMLMMMMADDEE